MYLVSLENTRNLKVDNNVVEYKDLSDRILFIIIITTKKILLKSI